MRTRSKAANSNSKASSPEPEQKSLPKRLSKSKSKSLKNVLSKNIGKLSPEKSDQKSPNQLDKKSPEILVQKMPEPMEQKFPEPMEHESPKQSDQISQEPPKQTSPEPLKQTSPEPPEHKFPNETELQNHTKLIDTGAGFYLDEEDLVEEKRKDSGAGFYLDDESEQKSPEHFELNFNSQNESITLTQDQLTRMEQNRKRALDLKQSKENEAKLQKLMEKDVHTKLIDTGAGFYLDEEDLAEEKRKESQIVIEPSVPTPSEHLLCDKCRKRFPLSYLSENFQVNICDSCRLDFPDEYKLITKTDCQAEFLLKDCDLNLREPPLKFILKKNPHHKGWGEMKLYLRSQVKERAIMVHEDLDKLKEKKEEKLVNLHKTRQKNYEKKVKVLRKEARLGSRKTREYHEHEFGEGVYNEDEDNYHKTCKTCEFVLEYEEL